MAEIKPIIRLFFAKMKEAFIDLPEEEKMAFMRKDGSIRISQIHNWLIILIKSPLGVIYSRARCLQIAGGSGCG